jgi:hypothetical protein
MAAFVVAAPRPEKLAAAGKRLSIFPGSATPTVFAANTPFWIGYGFVPDAGAAHEQRRWELDRGTRFELDVDGTPVRLETEIETEGGRPVCKLAIGRFPAGLPAGWHRFVGRWYDEGRLILTSDRRVEFIER